MRFVAVILSGCGPKAANHEPSQKARLKPLTVPYLSLPASRKLVKLFKSRVCSKLLVLNTPKS